MENKKKLSEKVFKVASSATKKAEDVMKTGEYKINIKLISTEIEKRKLYIGNLIYKWYNNNEIEKNEILKTCKEIMDLEEKINEIQRKISRLKELNPD